MIPKFDFELEQHLFDPSDPYNFQTNPDWLEIRADRITASYAEELMVDGKTQDGLGKTIRKRLNKRVMQRYTGWVDDDAASWAEKEAIRRGIIFEREAIAWYSQMTGRKVVPCGFVTRGLYLGCSPDGIVVETDERRMVQIKIPMPENYPEKIIDDGHMEYVPQVKMELFVCDFNISDLVIYSPELQAGEIIPIERDREFDKKILSKMRRAVQYQDKVDVKIREQIRMRDEMRTMRKGN